LRLQSREDQELSVVAAGRIYNAYLTHTLLHQRICIDTHYITSSPLNMTTHIEHTYSTYTRNDLLNLDKSIYHVYDRSLRLYHKHHICLSLPVTL